MKHLLPPLPYPLSALEPHVDARTKELEKLAVLVPPPREHLGPTTASSLPAPRCEGQVVPPPPAPPGVCAGKRVRPPRSIDWAALPQARFRRPIK